MRDSRIGAVSILATLLLVAMMGSSCQDYNCSWEELAPFVKLTKPDGEGPFPAVVLLHGCGGLNSSHGSQWAQRLSEWGYVSLQVDSFAPRKITGICAGGMIVVETLPYRVKDAYLARGYLSTLDFVDTGRIGVMGWSNGGTTAVKAVLKSGEPKRPQPFDAAVALYPQCYKPLNPRSPLLILSGGKDRWTPAEFCRRHAPVGNQSEMFTLKVYPEAYHCFDWIGIDTEQEGHILQYHAESAADAFSKVKAFLYKHLAMGRHPQ
ncbi:MAG: dienelactone hydrolase family protein [Desulfobulbaceae bacterium]|nr:dienelactone hydrolase family protein [Desulfobulbaceae bacterium]